MRIRDIILSPFKLIDFILKYVMIFFVSLYQTFLSLDHGIGAHIFPRARICLFQPSCSEYTKQSLKKYGVVKGTYLSIIRILQCGPWSFDKNKWYPVKDKVK